MRDNVEASIEVSSSVDFHGILAVTASETSSGRKHQLVVSNASTHRFAIEAWEGEDEILELKPGAKCGEKKRSRYVWMPDTGTEDKHRNAMVIASSLHRPSVTSPCHISRTTSRGNILS